MMNSKEVNTKQVNLQTQLHQYDKAPTKSVIESRTKVFTEPLSSPNGTLQIPLPSQGSH